MAKLTQPTPIGDLTLESVSGGMPENLQGGAETFMGGGDTVPADPGTNDTFAGTFGSDVLDGGAGSDVV